MQNKVLFIGVVFYYPDTDEVIRCIEYKRIYGLEVVVWNNGPGEDDTNQTEIKRLIDGGVIVLGEGKNIGLGESINKLCEWAICNGYKWMLSLDQDSIIEKLDTEYLETISSISDLAWIGVRRHTRKLCFSKKIFCIQSGSIISPHIISAVGGLMSDMFIDHVDHEICLRLQKENYSVCCGDIVQLKQYVGENKKIFGMICSIHNIKRFRYFVRNGFFCTRKHPEYSLFFFPQALKETAKQLLLGRVEIIFSLVPDALNGIRSKLGIIE